MKVSLEWFNDFTTINRPVRELCDAMTLSGSKVEGYEERGKEIANVVTGRVLTIDKHPNADRLLVCQVDVGEKTLQIVTGASNVTIGSVVPVALPGSTLAGGRKISKGKLRDVFSEGMLCSIQELGSSPDEFPEAAGDGIFLLADETKAGLDIKEVLGISDTIIEFEITSNRVDCFSVEGLAREAAVTLNQPFQPAQPKVFARSKHNSNHLAHVEIRDPDLCQRYCARVVENVQIRQSPEWLRRRLRNSGVRPINTLVDITNYVMLELGQPMHAFDLSALEGNRIIVRRAFENEQMTTLDGIRRKLNSGMLVIADEARSVALAGVMGAENSEISESTKTVLLESATFNPLAVRLAAKTVGLRTEASARFEKGLDSHQAERAMNRACELIELLECGDVCQGLIDCWPVRPRSVSILLDADAINNLLGTQIPEADMLRMLADLGCRYTRSGDDSKNSLPEIQIPSYRPDLTGAADLAEEIARLYDYNRIEPSLLSGKSTTLGGRNPAQKALEHVKERMIGRGFFEACTYSFESSRHMDKLQLPEDHPLRRQVEILNPLGEDYSRMRTTMVPSMLQIAAANKSRSIDSARMFEIAFTYHPKALPLVELPEEKRHLAAFWYDEKAKDLSELFFRMKGMVDSILIGLGLDSEALEVSRCLDKPWLHPGQCADLRYNGRKFGWVGSVHPDTAKAFDASVRTVLLDLDIDVLIAAGNPSRVFKPMPRYPAIDRDIALTCPIDRMTAELRDVIRTHGGQFLESVELFDVYQGAQVGEGKKSVAFSLKFRSHERTLNEADVQPAIDQILEALSGTGVALRS